MAISRITSQDATNTGGASVNVTYPGSTKIGDLLVAFGCSQGAISAPGGWSTLITGVGPGFGNASIFYKLSAGTETTISMSGQTNTSLAIFEFTGNTNPILTDGTAATQKLTGQSLTTTTPTITTTNANDLIFTGLFFNGSQNGTVSWSNGTVIGQVSNASIGYSYSGQYITTLPANSFSNTFSWSSGGGGAQVSSFIGAFQASPVPSAILPPQSGIPLTPSPRQPSNPRQPVNFRTFGNSSNRLPPNTRIV